MEIHDGAAEGAKKPRYIFEHFIGGHPPTLILKKYMKADVRILQTVSSFSKRSPN